MPSHYGHKKKKGDLNKDGKMSSYEQDEIKLLRTL